MGKVAKKVVKTVVKPVQKLFKGTAKVLGIGGVQTDDGSAAILAQQNAEAEARAKALEEQNRITRENQLILAGSTGTESAEKMGTVNPNATPSTSIGDVSEPKKKKTKGENYSASLGIV